MLRYYRLSRLIILNGCNIDRYVRQRYPQLVHPGRAIERLGNAERVIGINGRAPPLRRQITSAEVR